MIPDDTEVVAAVTGYHLPSDTLCRLQTTSYTQAGALEPCAEQERSRSGDGCDKSAAGATAISCSQRLDSVAC